MQAYDPESVGGKIGRRFGKALGWTILVLVAAKSESARLK
jgi:hypothetical protein